MSHNIKHIHHILHNREALEKLYRDSVSMVDVANKLGCEQTVVQRWIHKLGIPVKPRPATQKGKIVSEKTRKIQSEQAKLRTGNKNPNWRNGATPKNMLIRGKQWRERRRTILARDNYECVECGSDLDLHVHHIKSVKDFPELVNDPNNLKTLCAICHRKLHFPLNLANSVDSETHYIELDNAELSGVNPDRYFEGSTSKCVETIHEIVGNN